MVTPVTIYLHFHFSGSVNWRIDGSIGASIASPVLISAQEVLAYLLSGVNLTKLNFNPDSYFFVVVGITKTLASSFAFSRVRIEFLNPYARC